MVMPIDYDLEDVWIKYTYGIGYSDTAYSIYRGIRKDSNGDVILFDEYGGNHPSSLVDGTTSKYEIIGTTKKLFKVREIVPKVDEEDFEKRLKGSEDRVKSLCKRKPIIRQTKLTLTRIDRSLANSIELSEYEHIIVEDYLKATNVIH